MNITLKNQLNIIYKQTFSSIILYKKLIEDEVITFLKNVTLHTDEQNLEYFYYEIFFQVDEVGTNFKFR